MNVQKFLVAMGVLAAFAGETCLFGQEPYALPPLPNPPSFSHNHSSTELEGLGIGGGQFLQGLGLGWMYRNQGNLIGEMAHEQRLKNRAQALQQQLALQNSYQAGVAQRQAQMRAYNLAKQTRQQVAQVDLSWPADLRQEGFDPHRAALAEAVRQVRSGDGEGTTAVRFHARKLVETVAELVRAGRLDPRSLTAAIRFETALNEYASAVQASQLAATAVRPEQGLAER